MSGKAFGFSKIFRCSVSDFFKLSLEKETENILFLHAESCGGKNEKMLINLLPEIGFKKVLVLESCEEEAEVIISKFQNMNVKWMDIRLPHDLFFSEIFKYVKENISEETVQIRELCKSLRQLRDLNYRSLFSEDELKYIQLIYDEVLNKNLPALLKMSLPQINRMEINIADKMQVPHSRHAILKKAIETRLLKLADSEDEIFNSSVFFP